jgi:hypothetical protein
MTSEIEATSESIFEWLDQHFVSPAAMREAQIIGVQHVAPTADKKRIEIAFIVLRGHLRHDPSTEAAIRDVVETLLAARPDLDRRQITWRSFEEFT